MVTCSNCSAPAFYVYNVNPAFPVYYCSSHLPKFLVSQKYTGSVSKYEAPAVEEPVKTTSKKKATTVVEEPVVEEAAGEEEVTPEEE
jgi:hypothetical protein